MLKRQKKLDISFKQLLQHLSFPPNNLQADVGHQVLSEEETQVLGLHKDALIFLAHPHLGRERLSKL